MGRHPMYDMLGDFGHSMLARLEEAKDEKGYSYVLDDWEDHWRERMKYHFLRSNYIDLANYAMFGKYHGWKISES